jgi:hypothetical protein
MDGREAKRLYRKLKDQFGGLPCPSLSHCLSLSSSAILCPLAWVVLGVCGRAEEIDGLLRGGEIEASFRMGFAARFEEYRALGFLKTAPSEIDLANFAADFTTLAASARGLRSSVGPEHLPRVIEMVLGGPIRRAGGRINSLEERCVNADFGKRLKDRRASLLCRGMVSGRGPSSPSSSRSSSPSDSASSADAEEDAEEEPTQERPRRIVEAEPTTGRGKKPAPKATSTKPSSKPAAKPAAKTSERLQPDGRKRGRS